MSDFDHEHNQALLLMLTNDTVIPNAIPPQASQAASQRLAANTWIREFRQVIEKPDNSYLPRPVDPAK